MNDYKTFKKEKLNRKDHRAMEIAADALRCVTAPIMFPIAVWHWMTRFTFDELSKIVDRLNYLTKD